MRVLTLQTEHPDSPCCLRLAHQSRFWYFAACMVLTLNVEADCFGEQANDVRRTLRRDYRLRQADPANVWLVPAEVRLRDAIQRLESTRSMIVAAQKGIERRIEQNRSSFLASQQKIKSLRNAVAQLNGSDKKRREVERQIIELKERMIAPKDLGAVPEVRSDLIDLTNQRLQASIDMLIVTRIVAQLPKKYADLRGDQRLSRMLKSLGVDHRLGPLKDDYTQYIRRFDEVAQTVFTNWSPLYLQSELMRFGGLVNERTPIVFSWQDSSEETVLTSGVAEATGCMPSAPLPARVVNVAGKRLKAHPITIPTVRFGKHVLNNVQAVVLPPESEDVGCRIGRRAFDEFRVEPQPERLRIVVEAN